VEPMTNTGAMRDKVLQAILTSTQAVFSTMLGMDLTAGEAYDKKGAANPTDGVVSLIGLAGPWMGTGSIACSPALACKVSGALLMSEYAGVDDEVLDAMAEVTNMVIGNVKTIIEEEVGPMGLSIPTVIFGKNFATKSVGSSSWTVVPFTYEGETMIVQICLVQNNKEGQAASKLGFTNPQMALVE
jgi:chemotaxis protein CheX